MTDATPLDLAHALIATAPDPDGEQRARMAWFLRLLDTELFVLARSVRADAADLAEFPLEDGPVVIGFDLEERLAGFAGIKADFVALPGRVLAPRLAQSGVGLAVNPDGDTAMVLGTSELAWLADLAAQSAARTDGRIVGLAPPGPVDDAIVGLIGDRLARAGGLVDHAWLVRADRQDGTHGLLLAAIGVAEAARPGVVRALAEVGALVGEGFDVAVIDPGDPRIPALERNGIGIGAVEQEAPGPRAPGMDPDAPPRLR